ncbi:MAG: hypothetical protein ACRDSM_24770 [Pseudonocardiaceae bacterium]
MAPVFSPDGDIISYTQGAYTQGTWQAKKLVLWSHSRDQGVREIPLSLAEKYPSGLTFSPEGKFLGFCAGQEIRLRSLDSAGSSYSIPLVHSTGRCAFFFGDGSHGLTYIDGDEIGECNIATGRISTCGRLGPLKNVVSFRSPETLTVAPVGRLVVYDGDTGTSTWWDFDPRDVRAAELYSRLVPSVVLSSAPGLNLVAMADRDGANLFNMALRTPNVVYGLKKRSDGRGYVLSLSPDGKTIASVGEFCLIALVDTRRSRGTPFGASERIAAQPDDEHLATVSAGSVTIRSIKFSNSEPVIVRNPVNRELSGKRAESLS